MSAQVEEGVPTRKDGTALGTKAERGRNTLLETPEVAFVVGVVSGFGMFAILWGFVVWITA